MKISAQNLFSLQGSVAIVTGGAGNLGPTFGEALAEAGACVVLADIAAKEKFGRKAAADIARRAGTPVSFVALDVTKEKSVNALMASVLREYGKIDILVNGAIGVGKNHFAPVEKYSAQDFDRVLSVSVTGTFLCCRAVAEAMKKTGRGSIINIASIYGVVAADQGIYGKSGINSPASYAASKAAIIQLTRYLGVYWAKEGIRVNAISPGGVFNEQPAEFVRKYAARAPMGRMAQKTDLKGAVLFLASSTSGYVTGQNLLVDGGWTAW